MNEHDLALVAVYFIAILGLDVLGRESGQLSLGQGAFMAIGAYATAILVGRHGLGAFAAIPIAAGVAAAAGLAAALPGLLPVVTLGLALALPGILDRLDGPAGITFPACWFGYELTWGVALIAFLLAWAVVGSRLGRSLRAVRDNELGAVASGLNRTALRAFAVAFSAGYAGIAGSLLALMSGHVDPGTVPFELSLILLAGVAIGALGSIWGALIGAIAVEFLANVVGDAHATFAFGAILIVVLAVKRSSP
jgi:branched-chain amino acid transport system permease protein